MKPAVEAPGLADAARVAASRRPAPVGEVVEAGLAAPIEGRPDDRTLVLKDLGEKTFYGG